VHQFLHPLDLRLANASGAGVVAATLDNGAWRIIKPVPTAGRLPAGWSDGFYIAGGNVHVLTLHLSRFVLLRDVEAPAPPTQFAGAVTGGVLTLSWQPGGDNSGAIDHVSLFVDGHRFATYGTDRTQASLGAFNAGDPRRFTLSENDPSGNESAQTTALAAVPDLSGMTLEQATAELAAHGFTIGKVTKAGSATAAPGTVVTSPGVQLAAEGSAIDVTISDGAAGPLAFSVSHAPKLVWATSRSLDVRVTASLPAAVTATLVSPRGKALRRWTVAVRAGLNSVRLVFPASARRAGRYALRWRAATPRSTAVTRTSYVRVVVPGLAHTAAVAPAVAPPAPPAPPRPAAIVPAPAPPVPPAPQLPSTTVEIAKPAPPKPRLQHHRPTPRAVAVPRQALKPVAEALDRGESGSEKDNRLLGGLIGLAALLAGTAYWLSLSTPSVRRPLPVS
jgi:hypothetical protein